MSKLNNDYYLAVPFTVNENKHLERAIKAYRFEVANIYASALMRENYKVYSPISHSYPISLSGGLPVTWEYWKEVDEVAINICNELIVLCLDGWGESVGVMGEIEMFNNQDKTITFINPLETTPEMLLDTIKLRATQSE